VQRCRVQLLHVFDHLLGHIHRIALLALDVGDHGALGLSRDDVDVHRLGLPEPPATPDSLIKLLV